MATLHDVARVAGVSVTTVSCVVNNRWGRFSADTRECVINAMREVGYIPNTVARSLVRNRTDTIGTLLSNVTDEPFSRALRAAQHLFEAAGYDVIVTDTGGDVEREKRALANMQARRVDGILFISASKLVDSTHLLEFSSSGLPFVLVNRYLEDSIADQVQIDNISGTRAAVVHLASQGHVKIGCLHMPLTGPSITRANIERIKGYHLGMRDMGLEAHPEWLMEGAYDNDLGVRSGFDRTKELLLRERPSAIVCTNDYLAVGAFRAAAVRGLRVPQDLALTGHDNTAVARYHYPELTSVKQPIAEASVEAAKHLLALISGEATRAQGVWSRVLSTELVIRASSLMHGEIDPTS